MINMIEEDFRFATQPQIDSYQPHEFLKKPHLNGYSLIQLLDQVDERVLRHDGNVVRLFVVAPAGTALCFAKHFESGPKQVQISFLLEAPYYNLTSLFDLKLYPHVLEMHAWSEESIGADCVVVATVSNPREVYESLATTWCGLKVPSVVFDPDRQLADVENGRYFLNSSIWTRP